LRLDVRRLTSGLLRSALSMVVLRRPRMLRPPTSRRTIRAGWALDGGVVVTYLFLVTFGAFTPQELLPITLLVTAMGVLWLAHATIRR
jgi:hypothetical protein